MNKFINLRDGKINDTSYRPSNCQVTTLDDLITQAVAGSDDYLTASFDPDELCKHPQAYDFLNEYGNEHANCAGAGAGAEVKAVYEFAGEEFAVLSDNTVVVGCEE